MHMRNVSYDIVKRVQCPPIVDETKRYNIIPVIVHLHSNVFAGGHREDPLYIYMHIFFRIIILHKAVNWGWLRCCS